MHSSIIIEELVPPLDICINMGTCEFFSTFPPLIVSYHMPNLDIHGATNWGCHCAGYIASEQRDAVMLCYACVQAKLGLAKSPARFVPWSFGASCAAFICSLGYGEADG